MAEGEEAEAYEHLRRQKIAKNNVFLASLNLPTLEKSQCVSLWGDHIIVLTKRGGLGPGFSTYLFLSLKLGFAFVDCFAFLSCLLKLFELLL
jgi:hypothetical protein